MNFVQSVLPVPEIHALRQQGGDRLRIEIFERVENQSPENALRQALGRGIDRSDSPKMDRFLLIILDHFKLGVVHAKTFAAQLRLAENNELLISRDHFLDVV